MSAVLKLVQGSQEWLDYRRTMRNASETPAVLGISPWVTPYQLWLIKSGRSTQAVTQAMTHGTQLEPQARAAYEVQTGHVMNPLVMQDGQYSASLDGITLAGDLVLEVKCPFRGRQSSLWKAAKDGETPPYYAAQIQHQLMVSGAAEAHLWVYIEGEGIQLTQRRDEAAMEAIRGAWDTFAGYLTTDTPPPLSEADTAQRSDPDWIEAAQEFISAKQQADAASEALEKARQKLIDLTRSPRESGAGVSVVKLWKAGTVDYKKIPELRGVDLERYRGKGREEVRVAVAK
jgi:putative phage-type endonuclease